MFAFAILIGIYSYLIFFLGIFGLLYHSVIIAITIVFVGVIILWKRNFLKQRILFDLQNKVILFAAVLLGLQALVNLVGALGPELAFDALWYHLTLPKLYLENHQIIFIPGGLLYYSAMPKLGEMLYIAGLAFGDETIPKLIHFSFGLLTCIALYHLARKLFTQVFALLAVLIFYSNLVVGWESITAYVDLIRTFFEVLALWAFLLWQDSRSVRYLMLSSLLLGFAITTKLLAIGSLLIFIVLIISQRRGLIALREVLIYCFFALLIPLPWLIFSFVHTGNPVYPFFSQVYPISAEPFSAEGFLSDVWMLFTQASDPISPIYLMFLPLIILFFSKRKDSSQEDLLHSSGGIMRMIGIYSVAALIVWYFTPRTGGGRFILPYLPAFSLLCAATIHFVVHKKQLFGITFSKLLIGIVFFIALITILYRFGANMKYLPVLTGHETKERFLSQYLNYAYGDFYDTDSYFSNTITEHDRVLLYGFHNLYYVRFPFVDFSWVQHDDAYTYVATQNTELPLQFKHWDLVYENKKTMVKLYKE